MPTEPPAQLGLVQKVLLIDTLFLEDLTGQGAISPAVWGQLVVDAMRACESDDPLSWSCSIAGGGGIGSGVYFYLQAQATAGHFLLTAEEMGTQA